jgi:hypothetical protein
VFVYVKNLMACWYGRMETAHVLLYYVRKNTGNLRELVFGPSKYSFLTFTAKLNCTYPCSHTV